MQGYYKADNFLYLQKGKIVYPLTAELEAKEKNKSSKKL